MLALAGSLSGSRCGDRPGQPLARSHEKRGWFVQFLTEAAKRCGRATTALRRSRHFPRRTSKKRKISSRWAPIDTCGCGSRGRASRLPRAGGHVHDGARRETHRPRASIDDRRRSPRASHATGRLVAGPAGHQPVADILHIAENLRPKRLGDRLPVHGTRDELDAFRKPSIACSIRSRRTSTGKGSSWRMPLTSFVARWPRCRARSRSRLQGPDRENTARRSTTCSMNAGSLADSTNDCSSSRKGSGVPRAA